MVYLKKSISFTNETGITRLDSGTRGEIVSSEGSSYLVKIDGITRKVAKSDVMFSAPPPTPAPAPRQLVKETSSDEKEKAPAKEANEPIDSKKIIEESNRRKREFSTYWINELRTSDRSPAELRVKEILGLDAILSNNPIPEEVLGNYIVGGGASGGKSLEKSNFPFGEITRNYIRSETDNKTRKIAGNGFVRLLNSEVGVLIITDDGSIYIISGPDALALISDLDYKISTSLTGEKAAVYWVKKQN